jgi:hypothetical protein
MAPLEPVDEEPEESETVPLPVVFVFVTASDEAMLTLPPLLRDTASLLMLKAPASPALIVTVEDAVVLTVLPDTATSPPPALTVTQPSVPTPEEAPADTHTEPPPPAPITTEPPAPPAASPVCRLKLPELPDVLAPLDTLTSPLAPLPAVAEHTSTLPLEPVEPAPLVRLTEPPEVALLPDTVSAPPASPPLTDTTPPSTHTLPPATPPAAPTDKLTDPEDTAELPVDTLMAPLEPVDEEPEESATVPLLAVESADRNAIVPASPLAIFTDPSRLSSEVAVTAIEEPDTVEPALDSDKQEEPPPSKERTPDVPADT